MNNATKAALAVLLIAIASALGVWLNPTPEQKAQRKALLRREVATRVLAENMAVRFAGKKVLIVANPFTQKPGQPKEVYVFEEAGIRGLNKGWENKIPQPKVVFPDLKADLSAVYIDPRTTTPLSFLTTENAWDTLLQNNPDADLVVSLIGLPSNVQRTEIWRQPNRPQLALLLPDLRVIGNGAAVKAAFQSGKLIALVLNKPGAPPESAKMESDYAAEFHKRFLLVTAQNWDEISRTIPQLF